MDDREPAPTFSQALLAIAPAIVGTIVQAVCEEVREHLQRRREAAEKESTRAGGWRREPSRLACRAPCR